MKRYYRSRDGAEHTVQDRFLKITLSRSTYREQADLITTALNQLEEAKNDKSAKFDPRLYSRDTNDRLPDERLEPPTRG